MTSKGFETFDQLMKAVLDLFPEAEVLEDNDGQIVIYTRLMQPSTDQLVPFEVKEKRELTKSEIRRIEFTKRHQRS